MSHPKKDRNLFFVAIAAICIAAPAFLSTGYYLISGDPSLRPLAASRESIAFENRAGSGVELVATINWGRNGQAAFSQDDLRQQLIGAFYAHGEEVRVELRETDANRVTVTFRVGDNVFGPAEPSQAAATVRAAVDAYRLSTQ